MMRAALSAAGAVWLLSALARSRPASAWTLEDLNARCADQGEPSAQVRTNADRAWKYYRFLCSVVGTDPEIRGWWRAPACNHARGGEDESRHLEAGAIDVDLNTRALERLLRSLVDDGTIPHLDWTGRLTGSTAWGDRVRRAIGVDIGIGLIIYASGAVHIDVGCVDHGGARCRLRRSDFIEIKAA